VACASDVKFLKAAVSDAVSKIVALGGDPSGKSEAKAAALY